MIDRNEDAIKAYQKSIELELQDSQPDFISIAYSYDEMATLLHYCLDDIDFALDCSKRYWI